MKRQKTRRLGALLLAMMVLFTTLPVMALAEAPETEMPGVENVQAHETKETESLEMSEAGIPPTVRAPQQGTTKNLTVEVTLDTTMKMIMDRTQSYTFLVNGNEYEIPVTSNTGTGPITFTATFHDVPFTDGQTEADVKLESLPQSIADEHTVIEQNYDPNANTLRVVLGRNLYIRVFHLGNGVNYDNFATTNNFLTAQMTLFDEQGHEVMKSKLGSHEFMGWMPVLFGVRPGTYKLKITKIPGGESYDIDRMYTLRVQENGAPTLEIYQKDGAYHLANILGAQSAGDPMLDGYKNPLAICVAKKSKAEKAIVGGYENGKKKDIKKDDIVEYKITKTIYPDHNTVVNFHLGNSDFTNIGAYVDQGFTDSLDHDLKLQGSINVTLDGQPTTDFEAKYDAQSHSVIVEDKTKVKVNSLLYGQTTNIGEPQELVVTFKVKVKDASKSIFNTVDDSTTELIPFTVKVEKHWDDQENQAGKRPASVKIQLKANEKVVQTVDVTAANGWEYTFTNLPKKNADGTEIKYTVEELSVDGYKTVITGDATQGFTVTNTLKPTVEVTAKKVWEGDARRSDGRPASVEFILKADGVVKDRHTVTENDHWTWTFRNLPKLTDNDTEIVYTIEEVPVDGYRTSIVKAQDNNRWTFTVTNKLVPPPPTPRSEDVSIPVEKVWEDDGNRDNLRPTSVTVRLYADGKDTGKSVALTEANGWKGRFDALPKYDAGRLITYTVKEERVAHYDSSVSGNQTDGFTVTNRVEEPPKPPTPSTPPTPPTPPIPPTILVPRIPRAGVGA